MTDLLIKKWLEPLFDAGGEPAGPAYERWLADMHVARLSAGDYLIQAGEKSEHIFFINRGLVRLFYSTPDGKERNKAFYGDGEITGAISAAMTAQTAPFSIQVLESSEVLVAKYQPLYELSSADTKFGKIFINLLSQAFIRNEQREALLLTCNAEQRYRWLLEQEPQLIKRVPQFHIASYLGVDAVSLSRIKRKLNDE